MDINVFSNAWMALPVGLALAFGFSNGFRDASTIVATVVSTRALSPSVAFGLCAVAEFLGASLIGTGVSGTITSLVLGSGAVTPGDIAHVLAAGLAAAFLWGLLSWWRVWPTSNSQALIGGIAGASWVVCGSEGFLDTRKMMVFLILVTGPTMGFLVAAAVTTILRQAGFWMTTAMRWPVRALHVLACGTASLAHGSNDGQILIALLTLLSAAAADGAMPAALPWAERLAVAAVIAAGVAFGGQRLLRKLGMKFYRIRDMQGLGAQASAVATLAGCLLSGFPASTTQVISGSIVGAGVAKNARSVRWLAVREIALSWVVTVPASAAIAAGLALLPWGGR